MTNQEQKIEFISESFRHTQNIISFADTKSNISLTIHSLLISIVLGTSFSLNSLENIHKINDGKTLYYFYFIIVFFILSSIIGIILSIFVYKARSSIYKTEKGLFYFEHIAKFTNSDDYFSEINSITDETILKEITQSVYHLSNIAMKKMRYVNFSIYFLILNIILSIILLLLSGYISTL